MDERDVRRASRSMRRAALHAKRAQEVAFAADEARTMRFGSRARSRGPIRSGGFVVSTVDGVLGARPAGDEDDVPHVLDTSFGAAPAHGLHRVWCKAHESRMTVLVDVQRNACWCLKLPILLRVLWACGSGEASSCKAGVSGGALVVGLPQGA